MPLTPSPPPPLSEDNKLPTPVSPIESFTSQFSVNTAVEYPCTECNQVFYRAHNLKSHQATHSTSKPFQCSHCEKQFQRLHDLKRHEKLHTGERPYHCPICKRSFSRLDALNRHRRTESACYKKNAFIPAMTSQWQVSPPPPQLPSLILEPPPLMNESLVDNLRQRIHDLEIENRVLRSLLTPANIKEEEERQLSPSCSL